MIVERKFNVLIDDVDVNKEITNKAILKYLENIGCMHSDMVGNGANDKEKNGTTWLLLEWKLKVIKRAKYADEIEVHTWVRDNTKLFSYRDFEVYLNGELIAIASSKWILVDIHTIRPQRISEEVATLYQVEKDKNVFGISDIERLKELESYDDKKEFLVRKSDLDLNGHMHNLNYLDIAMEIADFDFSPREVRISYIKEIKYGEKIFVWHKKLGEVHHFKIAGENNSLHALIEFRLGT